jgi:hypothetical protein
MVRAVSGRDCRRWLLAVLTVGLLCTLATCAGARPQASCTAGASFGDCAVSAFGDLFGGTQCPSDGASEPQASTVAVRLEQLIEELPCPSSGRVSFGTTDDLGESMSVLDVIANPAGGYLGVYHTGTGRYQDALAYRVSLARSSDLIHWHRLAVLDPEGASMPTLRPIPGSPGFLLAYEKSYSSGAGHLIRLRYYATISDLLAGRVRGQRDLPLRLSQYNNGTPSILSIRWGSSARTSIIELGFHFETSRHGAPGPDREALGTLRGFRRFSARPDTPTDTGLDREGYAGSHGDWREFSFEGARWRLYEAQTNYNDFGSWHVLLQGPGLSSMYRLSLKSGDAAVANSFGNPVAQELPAPDGRGSVLVVTMFVFAADVPGRSGELVYYQPV